MTGQQSAVGLPIHTAETTTQTTQFTTKLQTKAVSDKQRATELQNLQETYHQHLQSISTPAVRVKWTPRSLSRRGEAMVSVIVVLSWVSLTHTQAKITLHLESGFLLP